MSDGMNERGPGMSERDAERQVIDAIIDHRIVPAWIMVMPTKLMDNGRPGRLVVTRDGTGDPDVNGTYLITARRISRAVAAELLNGFYDET